MVPEEAIEDLYLSQSIDKKKIVVKGSGRLINVVIVAPHVRAPPDGGGRTRYSTYQIRDIICFVLNSFGVRVRRWNIVSPKIKY